jgi:2-polyprenyl-3-methyl-5-hydroxy-6-metoxy-1,4-benzoquinol methylase
MYPTQPIDLQKSFWNGWNASTREKQIDEISIDQAKVIQNWLIAEGRVDLDIIDVGCGAGWLCSQLTPFGSVTGTDLSNECLERASLRNPTVKYVAGDFMELEFPTGAYDVVVSLEVLSHVSDQPAFVNKLSALLRPGGVLMMATQNKPVLMQNDIPPPAPGQLRKWVDRKELEDLLAPHFRVEQLFSITPRFNRGVWRIPNSYKLKHVAQAIGLGWAVRLIKRAQEQSWRGWTLMVLARKPA